MSLSGLVLGQPSVGQDRPEGVEIRLPGLGILGRDRAATDVPADPDRGLADPKVPFDPAVLLVRFAAVELEEHPETASVDGRALACVPPELGERCARDQGDVTAASVDRETGRRLNEAKWPAGPLRERGRPRALDVVAVDRPAVEVGRDLRPEQNLAVRNRSVGEAQRESFAVGVVVRADLNQRAVAQLVEPLAGRVDDVKPPVLANAVTFERDGLGMDEPQPLDGSERDPGHGWHLASVPVPGTGTKLLQKRKQSPHRVEHLTRQRHPDDMPRPPRNAYPGGFFHVGTRGNSRCRVFLDATDYTVFLMMLDRSERKYNWRVYSWCLMTTHYHLVVAIPDGALSQGICELNGSFARWSNLRHEREDHLFG